MADPCVDLIGIRHSVLDCYDLSRIAMDRLRRVFPTPLAEVIDEADGEPIEFDRDKLQSFDMVDVSEVPQVGDLVMMAGAPRGDGVEHLGVVVRPGMVLHTRKNQTSRVERLTRLRACQLVHSIWRTPAC